MTIRWIVAIAIATFIMGFVIGEGVGETTYYHALGAILRNR